MLLHHEVLRLYLAVGSGFQNGEVSDWTVGFCGAVLTFLPSFHWFRSDDEEVSQPNIGAILTAQGPIELITEAHLNLKRDDNMI